MLTKEKLNDIVITLSFEEKSEQILKMAQEELASKGLEANPFYVSLVFHRIWATICLSN